MYVIKDKEEFFEVQRGADVYRVPSLLTLPYSLLKDFQHIKQVDSAEIMDWIVDNVFDKFAAGLVDGMSFQQVADLCTAYMTQTDGETMGES